MRAFTHVCEKVNISLLEDMLTLYVKETGSHHVEYLSDSEYSDVSNDSNDFNSDSSPIQFLMPCTYVEDDHPIFVNPGPLDDLGLAGFMQEEDEGHDAYHQDEFNPDWQHYHIRFDSIITREKFSHIIDVFFSYEIISEDEKNNIMINYDNFNLQISAESSSNTNGLAEFSIFQVAPAQNADVFSASSNISQSDDIERVENEEESKEFYI